MPAKTSTNVELAPDKLQLVEELRQDLAATSELIPVYDWQRKELERRKDLILKNPGSGLSWQEVKRRIQSRHGR
jgi:putative addiction module component (TIGR02574 family)